MPLYNGMPGDGNNYNAATKAVLSANNLTGAANATQANSFIDSYNAALPEYLADPSVASQRTAWQTQTAADAAAASKAAQDLYNSPENVASRAQAKAAAQDQAGELYHPVDQPTTRQATDMDFLYQTLTGRPQGGMGYSEGLANQIKGPNKDLVLDFLKANQNAQGGEGVLSAWNLFSGNVGWSDRPADPKGLELGKDPNAWNSVVAAYNKYRNDTGMVEPGGKGTAQVLRSEGLNDLADWLDKNPNFTLSYVG
jgi:hypothetical protein